MDIDGFWALIERSRRQRDREEWLTRALTRLDPARIEDFELWLQDTRDRVDSHRVWGAAYLILNGFCSGDSFWYFQPWLIGLGRPTFERVAADPDELAGLPEIRRLAARPMRDWGDDEWPEWESLAYVGMGAYEQLTGVPDVRDVLGERIRCDPAPADESWDFDDRAEMERRYPRLTRMFPARVRSP